MGYSFTIESANTVANLTFGEVMSCYQDIRSSEESYYGFKDFLLSFRENIHSDVKEEYIEKVNRILEIFSSFEYSEPFSEKKERDFLEALRELSEQFKRCRVKSLLLPRENISGGYNDGFMTDPDTFKRLLNLHKGDSCLILQPRERPRKVTTVFNAFPNFDVALRQADLWPAVMFWDNHKNYAFVPIKDEEELYDLYKIVRDEREPINELKKIAEKKKKTNHYIFQLSDLHFGARGVKTAIRRLKSLIESQFDGIETTDSVNFVITGDYVDSPNSINKKDYYKFLEYLGEQHYVQKLFYVLGNHDINDIGLAFFGGKQRVADMVGGYPKIEVLEDSKVILLLFNSNTCGMLARGKIGEEQMAEMSNKLDRVKNLSGYLPIAVMHHHLLPIPQPDNYDKKWYEKILPDRLRETFLELEDADLFMEWLKERNVKFVLHGHKHIPIVMKHENNGINVISCGSSTGRITHRDRDKTYISYNLIKISEMAVTCSQFAEEILGAGAKHIRTEIIHR
jgi:predicted phosphodiesterase